MGDGGWGLGVGGWGLGGINKSNLLSPVSRFLTPHHCGLIVGAAGREGEGMGMGTGEAAGWGEVSLSLTK